MEAGCDNWPKTKAISCLKRADLSENPFAKARTAGMAEGRSGGDARSLRPNIALYRRNNGRVVSSNAFSSFSIDSHCLLGGAGSIDAKSLRQLA